MDWRNLFLTSKGRIGQRDFWIGFAILFVAGFVLGMIPILGALISLALIYPNVCIFAKRLHDFGKTGWLAAAPYVVGTVGLVLMFVLGGGAMLASVTGDAAATAGALGAMGMIGVLGLLLFLFYIGFLLWVGLSKSDPGENLYGPPPALLTSSLA